MKPSIGDDEIHGCWEPPVSFSTIDESLQNVEARSLHRRDQSLGARAVTILAAIKEKIFG
jgi:hypothetical protein